MSKNKKHIKMFSTIHLNAKVSQQIHMFVELIQHPAISIQFCLIMCSAFLYRNGPDYRNGHLYVSLSIFHLFFRTNLPRMYTDSDYFENHAV